MTAATAAWFWYRNAAAGSPWMAGLAAFPAFDIEGGVVTNATSTAKRWFHRKGEGFAAHFRFQALHLVHITLPAFVLGHNDWLLPALLSARSRRTKRPRLGQSCFRAVLCCCCFGWL